MQTTINSNPGLTPQLYYRIESCQTDNAHCHQSFWTFIFHGELVFYSIVGSLGIHWWPGLNRVWIYRNAGGLLKCLTGFDFIDIFGLWSWAGIDYIDLVGDTFWEGFRFITIESHHPGQRGNTNGDPTIALWLWIPSNSMFEHINHSTMVFQAMVHNNRNKAVSFEVSHDFLDRNYPVALSVPPWKLLHLRLLTTKGGGAKHCALSWEPLEGWFHKFMGMSAGVGKECKSWRF